MPPPTRSRSTRGRRCSMTPSLSLTFDPPRTTVYGPLRVLGEAVENLDLLLDEEAGGRGQDLGEVVDARLLAVHDAEPVRDERVAEFGELRGEGAALGVVLRRLARVEAEVLDHRDVAVLEGRDGLVGGLPHGVARERDGLAEQLRQPLRDRLEAVLRVGRAVGAPEVRADDDAGALVDEGVERGERCPHTAIVRDDAVLQGDVQVTTDDDALACERTQRIEGAQSHGRTPRGARPRTR